MNRDDAVDGREEFGDVVVELRRDPKDYVGVRMSVGAK